MANPLWWLPEPLHHVAARIIRADSLACDLAAAISDWSMNADLQVVEERRGAEFECQIGHMRPIPPTVGLYFSEIMAHLRIIIDNAMWFLVGQEEG